MSAARRGLCTNFPQKITFPNVKKYHSFRKSADDEYYGKVVDGGEGVHLRVSTRARPTPESATADSVAKQLKNLLQHAAREAFGALPVGTVFGEWISKYPSAEDCHGLCQGNKWLSCAVTPPTTPARTDCA